MLSLCLHHRDTPAGVVRVNPERDVIKGNFTHTQVNISVPRRTKQYVLTVTSWLSFDGSLLLTISYSI